MKAFQKSLDQGCAGTSRYQFGKSRSYQIFVCNYCRDQSRKKISRDFLKIRASSSARDFPIFRKNTENLKKFSADRILIINTGLRKIPPEKISRIVGQDFSEHTDPAHPGFKQLELESEYRHIKGSNKKQKVFKSVLKNGFIAHFRPKNITFWIFEPHGLKGRVSNFTFLWFTN